MTEPDRLAAVLGSLSLATDLVDGYPPDHSIRTAAIAAELAARLGLGLDLQVDAYWGALCKLLGCTAFSSEEASLSAGEDIGLRSALGIVDEKRPAEFIGAAVRSVGRGAALHHRALGVTRLLAHPGTASIHHAAQCEAGVVLGQRLGLGAGVISGLLHDKERWDGRGAPAGVAGTDVSIVSRIAVVAEQFDLWLHRAQLTDALEMVARRRGGWFDPEVCAALEADTSPLCIAGAEAWDRFLDAEPGMPARLTSGGLDRAAETFARFVDLKSRWTLTHSTGVGALAVQVATAVGFAPERAARLRRAALLHDVGRVAVPNSVWDCPGPLSVSQREQVRSHAYWTERILGRSHLLAELATLAGAVHERPRGDGYPRGVSVSALDADAALLGALDAYGAMGEDRPHRPRLDDAVRARELGDAVEDGRLDRAAVATMLDALGESTEVLEAMAITAPQRPAGLTLREIEVIRAVASGATNKEVGRQLGITAKTAAHHVAHVYTKTGITSRAGLALFAIDHGLLDSTFT